MKLLNKLEHLKLNSKWLEFFQIKYFSSSTIGWCNNQNVANQWKLHKPGNNKEAKGYIVTDKTDYLLQEHIKFTDGQVRTRFAPEPSGQLHLGHAKAVNINFGYAKANNGICFLRFDDTNPKTSDEISCQNIKDMITWLGFQPYKVTYTSDYFNSLYEIAFKLIRKDLAFVCHDAAKARHVKSPVLISSWRSRPITDSLREFENMQNGKYKEGEATLRLKHTTADSLVDPVAYRIKKGTHFRTGEKWNIYPTYDYSHCLTDSMEHITHSLCSAEFYQKKPTYYWLCNAAEMYCPVQTEFGRLNILNTVVSKRKINILIDAGIISGWDDIRLHTLAALKRRGVPPNCINYFTEQFSNNLVNNYIEAIELDVIVRTQLKEQSKRYMCVMKPIKVEIVNFPYNEPRNVDVPLYHDKTKENYQVTFAKDIWIDSDDFQEIPSKKFWRLTEGKCVGLKYSHHTITLKEVVKNPDGSINMLKVTCEPLKEDKKPKAFIHWLFNPQQCEIRIPDRLLKSDKHDQSQGALLKDVNENSLTVIKSLVDRNVSTCNIGEVLQFERIGYFRIDELSTKECLVFNKTCDLRQKFGFKEK